MHTVVVKLILVERIKSTYIYRSVVLGHRNVKIENLTNPQKIQTHKTGLHASKVPQTEIEGNKQIQKTIITSRQKYMVDVACKENKKTMYCIKFVIEDDA